MDMRSSERRAIVGIVGWKNSGKTTLTEKLVAEFSKRGVRVATIKHAHHGFDVDQGNTDSARHRQAGAQQVAVVSARRWALMRELKDGEEPSLDDIVAMLDPADVVIVEGYKKAAIPKIETRRSEAAFHTPLYEADPFVIAIASDHPVTGVAIPTFELSNVAAIADFIDQKLGLMRGDQKITIPFAKESEANIS